MAFVIGEACIDYMDRSCVEECPVDCIYEGERKLYINPNECIDCGACELACPVEAITVDRKADPEFKEDAKRFFLEILPTRAEPVGNPGGAAKVDVIGVDTPMVAAY
ncbi:ferredoxin [Prescottella equi]|uniref:ferredoxin n=1 Tax=Rhodococcus hoagii TaxID=43767 RepID=UPI000A0F6DFF|nr:ferredoxin [Prescottella equi]ORL85070.1 (4Fe-4S)-binding protein [Prescottella equi]